MTVHSVRPGGRPVIISNRGNSLLGEGPVVPVGDAASLTYASVAAQRHDMDDLKADPRDRDHPDAGSRGGSGAPVGSHRPAVLALLDFYPPAYRAGGPLRAVPRIVEAIGDEFQFRVITRDGDLGVSTRLKGVVSDRWVDAGHARCLYLSPRRRLVGGMLASIRGTYHDVLYLNSFFSIEFSLIPLILRKVRILPRQGLVIAPRGEMDARALAIKRRRKRLYVWFVQALRLVDDAIWHAASQNEAEAIEERFGPQARLAIAPDIAIRPSRPVRLPTKETGRLDVVFLSRIARMKNLDFAITVLGAVEGELNFDIFGPMEDRRYWAECERLADGLPENVTLRYRGDVRPEAVTGILQAHHLFFLPTQGESFGHAIVESLMAGCPVLISDQTRWRNLAARRAGWDLPLSRPDLFRQVIERCIDMTEEDLAVWSDGARRLGREVANDPDVDAAYRRLFRAASASTSGTSKPIDRRVAT